MTYVLIIMSWFMGSTGYQLQSIRFNHLDACEASKTQILSTANGYAPRVKAFCVEDKAQ